MEESGEFSMQDIDLEMGGDSPQEQFDKALETVKLDSLPGFIIGVSYMDKKVILYEEKDQYLLSLGPKIIMALSLAEINFLLALVSVKRKAKLHDVSFTCRFQESMGVGGSALHIGGNPFHHVNMYTYDTCRSCKNVNSQICETEAQFLELLHAMQDLYYHVFGTKQQ